LEGRKTVQQVVNISIEPSFSGPRKKLELGRKETDMKRAIAASIAALVLLVAIGFLVTRAEAETLKYKITSYVTKVEMLPVPDVENHFIGEQERRGVAIFENGETAAYHMWCTLEFISGQGGSYKGYSTLSFGDGSTSMIKFEGTQTGEKLWSGKGTGEYIKGTGRFEGIKGNITYTNKLLTPYTKEETKGDQIVEATGTYTLPKK
jgi:hypothetical protein